MNLAPIRESQSLQLRGVAIRTTGASFRLIRTFDLAPIQGASLWWLVPRVETWAESSCPLRDKEPSGSNQSINRSFLRNSERLRIVALGHRLNASQGTD